MRHSSAERWLLPLVATLAGASCTTMGAGTGATATGKDSVRFSWKSSDSASGTIIASLSDGTTYSGQFIQITRLEPVWVRWGAGYGWDDWGAGESFARQYTDRVVANLSAPSGAHIRCNFQLANLVDGMAGGGSGKCQMPDGKTIDAHFPKT